MDIPALEHYGLLGDIVVCANCGFVYVPRRRSAEEIADSWSHDIFGSGYTSEVPYVQARLFWVAQELTRHLDLDGKTVIDVGAGEGLLLRYLHEAAPGARLIGVDPGQQNARALTDAGFTSYCGTAQDLAESDSLDERADLVTLTWTLENSNDCRAVLRSCGRFLRPQGHIAIATGSRLLVPFKKPLDSYVTSQRPSDTHAFRFSRNSLGNLLAAEGFTVEWENPWIESDWMLLIARKGDGTGSGGPDAPALQKDSAEAVVDFFSEWHRNTEMLKAWRQVT